MFAKTLAVVRDEDHPGLVEDGPTFKLVDQPPQLLIQVGDAVIVSVASHRELRVEKARSAPARTDRLWDRPGGRRRA